LEKYSSVPQKDGNPLAFLKMILFSDKTRFKYSRIYLVHHWHPSN